MDLTQNKKKDQSTPKFGLLDRTYYHVLGLSRDATQLQIRHAYLRVKNAYSEGNQAHYSLISNDERVAVIEEMEKAFDVLNNLSTRALYDQSIGVENDKYKDEVVESGYEEPLDIACRASAQNDRLKTMRAAQNNGDEEQLNSSIVVEDKRSPFSPVVGSSMLNRTVVKGTVGGGIKRVSSAVSDESVKLKLQEISENIDQADGAQLKLMREISGVSIDEVHNNTKLSLQFLADLENNNFSAMPAKIYLKGMLVSYFKFLGLSNIESLVKIFTQQAE
jgi:curved DNA-binding protein CbpA